MKRNLQRKGTEQNINFWFGSAMHFAMEEYFGYNRFGDLSRAFQGYYAAFPAYDRPPGADEHYYLGLGMIDYFKEWYPKHNQDYQFETVWLDENDQQVPPGTEGARPLVEESFMLNLGVEVWVRLDTEQIIKIKDEDVEHDEAGSYVSESFLTGDILNMSRIPVKKVNIFYHGTMDRIVQDKFGRWWIMDWKTAKSADVGKLDTDDQISAYLWAAEQWFGRPIHGFVYVQLTKDLPKQPKRLATGLLSTDKKQKITYSDYRRELLKDYGEIRKAPAKMVTFLNDLAALETPEGDRFIRWDLVTRTKEQKIATYRNIMGEVRLMVDPDLHLYPNPTRDCSWDCPFRDACIMEERGQYKEVENWINAEFEPRPRGEDGNIDPWRKNIPWPDTAQGDAIGSLVDQMEISAESVLNIILPDKYNDLGDK